MAAALTGATAETRHRRFINRLKTFSRLMSWKYEDSPARDDVERAEETSPHVHPAPKLSLPSSQDLKIWRRIFLLVLALVLVGGFISFQPVFKQLVVHISDHVLSMKLVFAASPVHFAVWCAMFQSPAPPYLCQKDGASLVCPEVSLFFLWPHALTS